MGEWPQPLVASDGTGYLVVWPQWESGTGYQVLAKRFSASEACSCRLVGAASTRERSSMLAAPGALVLLGAIRRRRVPRPGSRVRRRAMSDARFRA